MNSDIKTRQPTIRQLSFSSCSFCVLFCFSVPLSISRSTSIPIYLDLEFPFLCIGIFLVVPHPPYCFVVPIVFCIACVQQVKKGGTQATKIKRTVPSLHKHGLHFQCEGHMIRVRFSSIDFVGSVHAATNRTQPCCEGMRYNASAITSTTTWQRPVPLRHRRAVKT